jgi:diadenylate cyclase
VYLVIAILILFQEDIRSALARAGGIFSRRSTAADANLMEDVIRATFELARKKIGALVAFERGVSLDGFVDGAHRIDSTVSTELLQSIFHPSSPLHDGAVVIAHNRLVAAGVFLPINLSRDVSRSFGTRHRAAIGLSEATDAVCLVVSEERGTVTIVEGGEVIPVADADDLREHLQERLGRPVRRNTLNGSFRVEPPGSQQSTNNG